MRIEEEKNEKVETKADLSLQAGQNEVTEDAAVNLSKAFSDAKEIAIAPTIFSTAPNRWWLYFKILICMVVMGVRN